jgi:hypothetical protein
VLQERKVFKGLWEQQECLVLPALLVHRGYRVSKELRELSVCKEYKDNRVCKGYKVYRVYRVFKEYPVLPEPPARQ